MENKLIVEFSKGKNFLVIKLGNIAAGPFSLVESGLKQIEEFYSEGSISFDQAKYGVRKILKTKNNLKTNMKGSLTHLFLAERFVPTSIGVIKSKLSEHIYLQKEEGRWSFSFVEQMDDCYVTLSEHYICKYNAYKFLNFLKATGIIDKKKFIFLDESIKRASLKAGNRMEVSN